MLTKEDLQAIGALIKDSEERIRKDMVTKSDLEVNNKVLGTIFRVELASTTQELKAKLASKKDVKSLEQKTTKYVSSD